MSMLRSAGKMLSTKPHEDQPIGLGGFMIAGSCVGSVSGIAWVGNVTAVITSILMLRFISFFGLRPMFFKRK